MQAKFERKTRTLFGEETKTLHKDRIEERPHGWSVIADRRGILPEASEITDLEPLKL